LTLPLLNEDEMETYLRVCSICLARAHARTGNAAAIAGYIGKNDAFIDAVTDFAQAYSDQIKRDYAALKEAVETGRIEAKMEI